MEWLLESLMVEVIGQPGRRSRESQVLGIVGLELPEGKKTGHDDTEAAREQNNGCRNTGTKV